MNIDWHAEAACRDHPDPDMWFPEFAERDQ